MRKDDAVCPGTDKVFYAASIGVEAIEHTHDSSKGDRGAIEGDRGHPRAIEGDRGAIEGIEDTHDSSGRNEEERAIEDTHDSSGDRGHP